MKRNPKRPKLGGRRQHSGAAAAVSSLTVGMASTSSITPTPTPDAASQRHHPLDRPIRKSIAQSRCQSAVKQEKILPPADMDDSSDRLSSVVDSSSSAPLSLLDQVNGLLRQREMHMNTIRQSPIDAVRQVDDDLLNDPQLLFEIDSHGRNVFHGCFTYDQRFDIVAFRRLFTAIGPSVSSEMLGESDCDGWTPLRLAVRFHRPNPDIPNIVQVLLAFQVALVEIAPDLLHDAARFNKARIVRDLVEFARFAPLRHDSNGLTAFHVAAMYSSKDTLHTLTRCHLRQIGVAPRRYRAGDYGRARGAIEKLRMDACKAASSDATTTNPELPPDLSVLLYPSSNPIDSDFSDGKAPLPLPLYNNVDTLSLPQPAFVWSEQSKTALIGSMRPIIDEVAPKCACVDGACYDGACPCVSNNLCSPYDNAGSVRHFNSVYTLCECGPLCACSARTCPNRTPASRRPQLAIMLTDRKGFGVRTAQPLCRGQLVATMPGAYRQDMAGHCLLNGMYTVSMPFSRKDEVARKPQRRASTEATTSFAPPRVASVDCATLGNVGRFLNHQCKPLCQPIVGVGRGSVTPMLASIALYAGDRIARDTEITWNYGKSFWRAGIFGKCTCGHAECFSNRPCADD